MVGNSLNISHTKKYTFIAIAQIKRYICLPDCDVFSQSAVVGNAKEPIRRMNFEKNIKDEIFKITQHIGFKINRNQDLHKFLLNYLTVRKKLIEIENQKIIINSELAKEILFGDKRNEIKKIIEIARQKGNLNFFLSKRALQSNFHDHLQNEWNIYHFHLSLEKDKKSNFVKQCNSLLFAYIDKNYIVFLGTETHKEGIFGDLKWVEILHEKFPFVIEEFKDSGGIIDVYPKLNSLERQTLWSKGISLGFYKIKDTIYHSPGIGRVTSGHSMDVSTTAMEIMRWLKMITEQLVNMKKIFAEQLNINEDEIDFQLEISNEIEIVEKKSNKVIINFPKIFVEK